MFSRARGCQSRTEETEGAGGQTCRGGQLDLHRDKGSLHPSSKGKVGAFDGSYVLHSIRDGEWRAGVWEVSRGRRKCEGVASEMRKASPQKKLVGRKESRLSFGTVILKSTQSAQKWFSSHDSVRCSVPKEGGRWWAVPDRGRTRRVGCAQKSWRWRWARTPGRSRQAHGPGSGCRKRGHTG